MWQQEHNKLQQIRNWKEKQKLFKKKEILLKSIILNICNSSPLEISS